MSGLDDSQIQQFCRFMLMVQVERVRGACWEWQGNSPDGLYGHFSVDGKTVKAHRWIHQLLRGPIPDGILVRHRCDNPKCVNPQHLVSGTPAENTADMYERGRNPDRKGENHPLSRLTGEQVTEIRSLKAMGVPTSELATRFGVGDKQIGKIVRRENWKHI